MERNRWETAIRCLEIALHPNTSDDEVIAGVNGFRRTAAGKPLGEICAAFAGADPMAPRDRVARLDRDNRDLRRKLEAETSLHVSTQRRLHDAEARVRALGDELLAAQHRAAQLKQDFAEFRAAHGRIADRAAEHARRAADPPPPAFAGSPPFRQILAAARGRADHASPAAPHRAQAGNPRTPWTA